MKFGAYDFQKQTLIINFNIYMLYFTNLDFTKWILKFIVKMYIIIIEVKIIDVILRFFWIVIGKTRRKSSLNIEEKFRIETIKWWVFVMCSLIPFYESILKYNKFMQLYYKQ